MFQVMGAILCCVLFLSKPASADVISAASETASRVVIEVSQRIAAGRISQQEAATLLNSQQQAASLWAAISSLKAQGGIPQSSAAWEELKRYAETRELNSHELIRQFGKAAQARKALNEKNLVSLFLGTSERMSSKAGEAPEETFRAYHPTNPRAQALKNQLLSAGTRTAELRITTLGKLLQLARGTAQFCSASSRGYCAQAAPEAVLLWGAEGLDQAGTPAVDFIEQVLTGFPKDPTPYVGRAELPLRGFTNALGQGNARSAQLQQCLWRGVPSQN